MTDKTYANGVSMWRAVADRAKKAAAVTGRRQEHLIQEFVYSRLLARVFHDPDEPWVLKGGTALLARVQDARHSKDVDLLARLDDVDDAVAQLRRALARDLDDFFTFDITRIAPTSGTDQQPGVEGRTLTIRPSVGLQRQNPFKIDLVTGSLMTSDPDQQPAPVLIPVPGLTAPTYRLYPAVDHVADKLCATETAYADGRPSSRVRDLVDIVVLARTQRMSLTALHTAIAGERHKRGLPHRDSFQPPAQWAATYPRHAKTTPWCHDLDFADASALAACLVDPALVLAPVVGEQQWDPEAGQWGG